MVRFPAVSEGLLPTHCRRSAVPSSYGSDLKEWKVLFIVGGAARSGKTLLARRMLNEGHVAWFSLDALRAGLTKGAPGLGLDFDRDDLEEGDRLWPIVREIITSILRDDFPYLLESSCLRPSSVADLMGRVRDGAIRPLFLGYPELNAHEKLSQIAANGIGGNDWFSSLTDPDKLEHVNRMIKDSRTIRADCNASGMKFFDTGRDFEKVQIDAFNYLRRDAW